MNELIQRVWKQLSGHQKRLMASCVLEVPDSRRVKPGDLTAERFAKYLSTYFKDPLSMVRRQNDFIRGLPAPDRESFYEQAPLLNALVEKEAHVRPDEKPSDATHEERTGLSYLFHGDILPGTQFELGHLATYDRELLKINKDSPNTLPYTLGARRLAVTTFSEVQIARELLHALHDQAPLRARGREPEAGSVLGAGTIIRSGEGVCRHKAALLVQSLQEAGIDARYVRGDLNAGTSRGRHAWVHAELDGTPYLIDPEWNLFKKLSEVQFLKRLPSAQIRLKPSPDNPVYRIDTGTNVVWRRKCVVPALMTRTH
ncbi:transglutaminase domain-containing protein [Candidatus Micrarchaeota archaeon]|nr:transglutaminase domain-containing protein [Candidatus Micrarchaeota archaeon]